MDDHDRLPAFKKSMAEEQFFQKMNDVLQPWETDLNSAHDSPPNQPTILILGNSRTGSTYLNQILAARLNLGYVSNLSARFFECPSIGMSLQQHIIGDRYKHCRQFSSVHGATDGPEAPHEFGYFWARHLHNGQNIHSVENGKVQDISLDGLQRELNSMLHIVNKPIVFKCHIGNFFIPLLAKLNNVLFIDVQRDLLDVSLSTLKVRRERLGSEDKWWSFRPYNYDKLKALSVERQVAGQVVTIRDIIDKDLQSVPSENKLTLSFETLCHSPDLIIDQVKDKLDQMGHSQAKVGEPLIGSEQKPSAGDTVRRRQLKSALQWAKTSDLLSR